MLNNSNSCIGFAEFEFSLDAAKYGSLFLGIDIDPDPPIPIFERTMPPPLPAIAPTVKSVTAPPIVKSKQKNGVLAAADKPKHITPYQRGLKKQLNKNALFQPIDKDVAEAFKHIHKVG